MANPAKGEASFTYDGETYTLVFDMEAIARFEDETDISVIEIGTQMESAQNGGKPPKLSTLGSLLQAALSRHHPEVTRTEAMAMFTNADVRAQLGLAFARSMPKGEEGPPPKARPRKAGTGTR